MDRTIEVLTEAKDRSVISLASAKLALKIDPNDNSQDATLKAMIERVSGEIEDRTNRVLAKERVRETITDFQYPRTYLYLSRYPVETLEGLSVNGTTLEASNYLLEKSSGKLAIGSGYWWPYNASLTGWPTVSAVYTGGYDLPERSPLGLQQAATMMFMTAYRDFQQGGGAAVRMVSHKESRVMYYDPNASSGSGGSTSASERAVDSLLRKYMRFEV